MSEAMQAAGEAGISLCTHLGTIVFYDEAAGALRHGPAASVPRNLQLRELHGSRLLAVHVNGGWRALVSLPSGDALTRAFAGPLEVPQTPSGLVAVRAANVILSAAEGGVLHGRDATAADVSGLFLPLREAEHNFLAHVIGSDWYADSLGRVIGRADIQPLPGFGIRIGALRSDLASLMAARDPAQKWQQTLGLTCDGWKIERLVLYKPLIWMTAFGRADVFRCLALAVRSLREFGDYTGDIAVLSDRADPQVLEPLAGLGVQVLPRQLPNPDNLGFCLARYALTDIADIERHRPLLYLDTDVLCDRPIEPILMAIRRASKICLAPEHELLGPYEWYGASLFRQDPAAAPRTHRGLNTGIIGLPDIACAREPFRAIRLTGEAVARAAGQRDWSDCYDQPIANYVLNKFDAFDAAVLANFVRNSLGEDDIPLAPAGYGLIHCNGNVGDSAGKYTQMVRTLERMRAARRQSAPLTGLPPAAPGAFVPLAAPQTFPHVPPGLASSAASPVPAFQAVSSSPVAAFGMAGSAQSVSMSVRLPEPQPRGFTVPVTPVVGG